MSTLAKIEAALVCKAVKMDNCQLAELLSTTDRYPTYLEKLVQKYESD